MDQTDLIDLDPLLFLQGLFDGQYLIFWFEVKRLFTSRQCFDENLKKDVNCWRKIKKLKTISC
jgi:hypothetical protein